MHFANVPPPSSVRCLQRRHSHRNRLSLSSVALRTGVGRTVSTYEMVTLSPLLMSARARTSCAKPSPPRSARPSMQRKVLGVQSCAHMATSG